MNVNIQHVRIESSDRWIYIKEIDGEIVGLNFCQGDDYKYFKQGYLMNDNDILNTYNTLKNNFKLDDTIKNINAAIWSHVELNL